MAAGLRFAAITMLIVLCLLGVLRLFGRYQPSGALGPDCPAPVSGIFIHPEDYGGGLLGDFDHDAAVTCRTTATGRVIEGLVIAGAGVGIGLAGMHFAREAQPTGAQPATAPPAPIPPAPFGFRWDGQRWWRWDRDKNEWLQYPSEPRR